MADTIRFTLDGEEVEAEAGMTIWEVANGRGWCCRISATSRPRAIARTAIAGPAWSRSKAERTLAASCIREPAEGMVVTTNSARAESARRMVVEMLVADQPGRDAAHDRSAHFWDMAEANGVSESRLPKLKADRVPLLDDSHVAMRVNLDACISCGLCVRACREVQVNDVIGMAGRGHDAYPVFDIVRSDGGKHLCRLWRMRAGLPDRCPDARECHGRGRARRQRRFRPARSKASARSAAWVARCR